MDLINLLQQDGIRISERTDTPTRANYACPACGGDDRFIVWKNEGRYNAGKYWCNQCKTSGDVISYLIDFRHYTYPDAIEFMGGKNLSHTSSPTVLPGKERAVIQYDHQWHKSSYEFVTRCNKNLDRYESVLEERGITRETADRFMLGYNPSDQFVNRAELNLSEKYNEDGSKRKLSLPAGLVIPHYYDKIISSVRVRRKYDTEKYGKYHFVGSTNLEPLHIWPNRLPSRDGVIITEGELDAIRIAQEFADVDIIGMESASIGIPLDTYTYSSLFKYNVIALCFDNDVAGRTAAENLQRFLPNAYYVPVPKSYGKDVTDAFQNGLSPEIWKEYVLGRIDSLMEI